MFEKYPGVMMPPPEEVTPEVKKAISESIDKRTINIDNVTPEAQTLYIHQAGIDIDVAATYPDENTQKEMQKQISEDIQLGRGMTDPEIYVLGDPSDFVDKTSHMWGGIHPGTYSGTRGGKTTEVNEKFLMGERPENSPVGLLHPTGKTDFNGNMFIEALANTEELTGNKSDVVVNIPSQDIRLGDKSGHMVDWGEYKSETPYTVTQLSAEDFDRLQLERERNIHANSVATTEKPKRVAIIGGPRNIANHIIRVCEESGIEVTETNDRPRGQFYDEAKLIGNPNMKTISPAMLLNKHHHGASPYAHGKKPTIEDLSETMRKDMRKAQNATNKANGFGKRLTKKDKMEMAKHKDGWHDPELTPHITIIDGKEVLSFRRKKDIQTYVSKFEHEVAIKVPH